MAKSSVKQKKKARVSVSSGKAYVLASFNNTLVYITDLDGNTLSWATAGGQGFRGSRKSTPFAAQQAASVAAKVAIENYGMRTIDIYIKGPGTGREAAARAISASFNSVKDGKVLSIYDITGIPHNGVRAQKERRV